MVVEEEEGNKSINQFNPEWIYYDSECCKIKSFCKWGLKVMDRKIQIAIT